VLVSALDKCLVCAECITSMELLGGMCQVKARFDLFGDSVNLDAREVHGLHRTYHRLKNHFGHT
jgi:hypothetical protein